MKADRGINIGVVTAYNDMVSAHAVYCRYLEQMKVWARETRATAHAAGGMPAMCDGITQGCPGMDLPLFSRDTIARSTPTALSHGMFEGAALLGICDEAGEFAERPPPAKGTGRDLFGPFRGAADETELRASAIFAGAGT